MDIRKTPVFDWEKGEFKTDSQGGIITATGGAALEQIVIKAHSTSRGVFLIYADPADPDKNHKYGSDEMDVMVRQGITDDVRTSELQRAVREALIYDPWVTDVTDITIYEAIENGIKQTYADYTLYTVFDNTIFVKGAVIND